MSPVYVYGGYVLTGGTLDNGNSWQGINIMLAEVRPIINGGFTSPMVAFCARASRLEDIMTFVNNTSPGGLVHAYFSAPDHNGRSKLISIKSLGSDE